MTVPMLQGNGATATATTLATIKRPLLFAARTTSVPVDRTPLGRGAAGVKPLLFTSATTNVAVKSSCYVLPTNCKQQVLIAATVYCTRY